VVAATKSEPIQVPEASKLEIAETILNTIQQIRG
jgi:hypothetical protein